MKIQYLIAIHLMKWLTNFYDFRFKSTATAATGIHPTKACHSWWISKMQPGHEDTLEEQYAIKFCFKLRKNTMRWKLDLLLWPRDRVLSGSMLAFPDPRRPDRINPPTNLILFFDSTGMIYMHWIPTRQTVNKEYYVEVLREFRKRLHR